MMQYGEHKKELYGADPATTNNRMEMTAVIRALEALTRPSEIALYTDSQYLLKGVNEWMVNWKKRGWKTADKKPVKNVELWQQLDTLIQQHDIEWNWVKGHSGDPGNERVDELANIAIDEMKSSS